MIGGPGGYWVVLGFVYLVWLTYQDVFRGNKIDDRKNYFMLGLSVSLYTHFVFAWWYLLVIVGLVVLVNFLIARSGFFGRGDTNALNWLFIGLAILNVYYSGLLLVFGSFLVFYSFVWLLLVRFFIARLRVGHGVRLAFFPVILFSFLSVLVVFW